MSGQTISPENLARLSAFLHPPLRGLGSDPTLDRVFIDGVKAQYPGLDRSHPSVVVADRWIDVVILRGVQIMVSFRGYATRLIGALERPAVLIHRGTKPLALRTQDTVLFAPTTRSCDRITIEKAVSDGVSATLAIVHEVAIEAPIAGDKFAYRVWSECRARQLPGKVREYLALFEGRERGEQLEMALALSESVLTGKDEAHERLVQASAATQMWRELGQIEAALFNPTVGVRNGWLRVASLGIQDEPTRSRFLQHVRDAMPVIASGKAVDIEVSHGKGTRVYRFDGGTRSLIDRRGARVKRIH
jgi:hypothetical protein